VTVSYVRLFRSVEQAKEMALAFNTNARCPTTIRSAMRALKPDGVVLAGGYIGLVLRVVGLAKVAPSIVGLVEIDMVNLLRGPFPGHIEPSKSVSRMCPALHANPYVSLGVNEAAGDQPEERLTARRPHPSEEGANIRIVVKQLLQTLLRKCHSGFSKKKPAGRAGKSSAECAEIGRFSPGGEKRWSLRKQAGRKVRDVTGRVGLRGQLRGRLLRCKERRALWSGHCRGSETHWCGLRGWLLCGGVAKPPRLCRPTLHQARKNLAPGLVVFLQAGLSALQIPCPDQLAKT
jgi:hypothetical protein